MNILYIHNGRTTFVKIDLQLLRKHYTVEELYYEKKSDIHLGELYQKIKNTDVVFGWFSSWHMYFPVRIAKLLKVPTLLVVGGYDTAKVEEADYGNQLKSLSRHMTN